ncbi:MAG: tRNA uridine-5-carboxymethylaminomethyl(34) synthesis GTPase MnmE [Alphaproteobacteria bacterium]|nr:tRNA uridine-5-carboxymethylaminomethyl(34) synthesis GTPase MnmE [Alphaproteobacteria bacterium]
MTIFAAATAPGRAAIAVVRISGERTAAALTALAGPLPEPRRMTLRTLQDPHGPEPIDRALIVWLPGPASYTGEDMAELHLHGGRAVIDGVLGALGRIAGLAPAEPGDFTRRAFANGRLDLTAAEGIADLISAETEGQRRQALRQLGGELGLLYDGWRTQLIRVMAQLEAGIDFPDEDLPADLGARIGGELDELVAAIASHLADGRRGERLRDGWRIALLGPPNVGKSSLLNRLARREAAIVAPEAGTTRDIVEVHLDLGGVPVIVADTAGLRATESAVEREGVRRAHAWAATADLKILIADSEHIGKGALGLEYPSPRPPPTRGGGELGPSIRPPSPRGRGMGGGGEDTLRVWNKVDLAPAPREGGWLAISCRTGKGLDALVAAISERIGGQAWATPAPPLTRARHRVGLEACADALRRAQSAPTPELVAEDLRAAAVALGRITGRVGVDDILDALFRDFCIGK